ncbi:glycosyltransferase [Phocoenobacter skyensis]|uniref:Glycosyltransferase n=1 Tax=Phocoenobacter skyensis TaxID=97481 RepID=A0ABT9JI31_9PAST|nr:glycosyltransferase [Pasteurella skyensis]MDP8078436.1 glycosyltransferase [Pasteurella skyensis]MDP8084472.1 glycosyltransferase [Pasteurella skyensis]
MSIQHSHRKKHYFFLFGGVFIEPTAIEIQACIRAKLFKKYLNITPTFITHGYHPALKQNQMEVMDRLKIEEDVPIFSLFDFYCDKQQPAEKVRQFVPYEDSNLRYEKDKNDVNASWAFLGEQLQMYIENYPNTQQIHYINYVNHISNDIEVMKRDTYDPQGYLASTGVVEPTTKEEIVTYFLDRDGNQRVTLYFTLSGVEKKIVKIYISNKQGRVTHIFNSKEDLVVDFIQKLADLYPDDELCFVTEHPIYYKALKVLQHPNVKIISVLHLTHTIEPTVEDSPFNRYFSPLVEELHNPKFQTVVLTEAQKQDIEARVGRSENLHCIPNTLNYQVKPQDFSQRDRFLLTAFARLEPQKRLDKMIDMFALVHQSIPQAKLEIYGVGRLQEQLQEQINRLSLQNVVQLKGFINNPYSVFERAGLALLTSHYEALPLVIMESLSAGCPFISFDIKYGPSEMIIEGENGYLVPENDIQMMTERVIHLLRDPQRHQQMSENASKANKGFLMEAVAEQWRKLLAI